MLYSLAMQSLWHPLTETTILDSVEQVLAKPLTALCNKRNSYINRVYELEIKATCERIIVKFYRPGRWSNAMIQAEHEFVAALSQAEIPVIAPLSFDNKTLFSLEQIPFAIYPRKGGRAIDEFDKELWEQIGRLIGRTHSISESFTSSARILWTPAIATKSHLETLDKTGTVLPDFKPVLFSVGSALIKKYSPWFEEAKHILIHGDCHRGNLIHRPGEGIFLIDFDDIAVGPAVQDLWMLLPDTPDKSERELDWFLSGYETFRPFPRATLKLIPALRAMRIIHFASWCAIQVNEPQFKDSFADWGSARYWNETIKALQDILYSDVED